MATGAGVDRRRVGAAGWSLVNGRRGGWCIVGMDGGTAGGLVELLASHCSVGCQD